MRWATAFAVLALAAGASWYWLGGGRAIAVPPPSPLPSPAEVETPAPATLDTAVTDAVERSFLLTPPTARALAQAWQQRGLSLDALEETALVTALHGVGALPRERADEVRRSFDGFYAALPVVERGEAERLFAAIRDGRAEAEEIARAVALMNLGAHRMDEPAQQRLQALYSAAVLASIEQREDAERLAAQRATYVPVSRGAPGPTSPGR